MERAIKKVAIAGAGVMGSSIAQYFAERGLEVIVYDIVQASLDKIDQTICENQQLLIERGALTAEQAAEARARVKTTNTLADFAQVDLVIEAIIEKMEIKQDFFCELEKHCRPDTIFATNTSGLSVNGICEKMKTGERFIGANWWTPAHIVPLIEIVRADITSDDTAKRLYDFFESVGKKPILINREVKGFVGNRIQFAVMREAMNIVENGYASCEDVDRVLHYGLGLRYAVLGPFRTADFGGVDTFCHISDNLFSDLSTRTDANDMIRKLYEENKLGIKTGEGFYQYTPESIQEGLRSRDEQLLDILKITT